MDNNQEQFGANVPGVRPDYATRLAAMGVDMTDDGKVRPLGDLLREIVNNGGGDLPLEKAMAWAARAEVADAEIASLVVDSSQMLKDLEMFNILEGQTGAGVYGLEALAHLQTHMEKMVFGYLYGVRDGGGAKEALFGPRGESGE